MLFSHRTCRFSGTVRLGRREGTPKKSTSDGIAILIVIAEFNWPRYQACARHQPLSTNGMVERAIVKVRGLDSNA